MSVTTLYATKDSYIHLGAPDSNYGGNAKIITYGDTSMEGVVGFDTSGLNNISNAVLRLYATDFPSGWGNVSKLNADFSEYGVTWNNCPGSSGLIDFIHVSSSNWLEINVTSLVIPTGAVGFRLQSDPGAYGNWTSKEGVQAPQLVVTYNNNTAPNAPTITSPTSNQYVNTRTPTVSWTFSDPDAGNTQSAYLIQVVNDAYNAVLWSSGWVSSAATSYTLPAGAITADGGVWVRMQVQDQNGAISSPTGGPGDGGDGSFYNRHFTVDTIAPAISSVTGTQYVNVAANGTFRVYAYGVTDSGSGINRVQFPTWTIAAGQDDLDGSWQTSAAVRGTNAGGGTWYYDVPLNLHGNAEGQYQTDIYAFDNAGNQVGVGGVYTFVDRTLPTISGDSIQGFSAYQQVNNNSGNLRMLWTYNDATAQTKYRVVGSNNGWATWTYDSGEITSVNKFHDIPFSSLGEGTWHFSVNVMDSAANWSGYNGNYHIIIDRTAPAMGAPSAQQYTSSTTATVYVDGVTDAVGMNRVQVYAVRPDQSYYDIGNATLVSAGRYSINVTGLTIEGNWHYDFRAYDNAGNVSNGGNPIGAYVMHDTSLPVIGSGDGDRFSNQNSGVIRHTVNNVSDATSGAISATFQIRKSMDNGVTWAAWGGVFNGTQSGTSWYYDVAISGDGLYQIAVMIYDRAGNASGYYYMSTTIDSVLAADPNPQVVYEQTTATFTWNAFSDTSPSSGWKTTDFFLGEWNGSGYVGTPLFSGTSIGNVTSKVVTGLVAGTRYRYTVTYHDNAGNESGYTYKEFITKKQVGTRKIHKSTGDIILPVYDIASGVLGSKAYRTRCAGGITGCYELVSISDPNASPERINTPQGIRAISKL